MGLIEDLLNMMSGSFSGLPSLIVMAIPLFVGLIIGYILKKIIKVGIILVIVAAVAAYFGFINLGTVAQEAKDIVTKYGPIALSYIAIFFGIMPLSVGLIIGIIIGFVLG